MSDHRLFVTWETIIMKLLVFKDYFAPKILETNGRIHGIYCSPCNFRCGFCSQSKRNTNVSYPTYTLDSFGSLIDELIKSNNMFKITGGEPTILPEINEMMKIIKSRGGMVYLDTNGSQIQVIKKAINEGFVDVLGISIKGLTPEEARNRSGVTNGELCWDNVLESCNYAYGKAKVILTYVMEEKSSLSDLIHFCRRIDDNIHIDYLKFNNLYGIELPDPTCKPMSRERFNKCIESVVAEYPNLKGRIIIIDGFEAVQNKGAIRYL